MTVDNLIAIFLPLGIFLGPLLVMTYFSLKLLDKN